MNNFEQDAPLRDELQQIVENLNFILENTKNISPIERDIILQHLRDAYLAVLKLRTESIIDPAPIAKPEPVKETKTIVEPEPVVKTEPVENSGPSVIVIDPEEPAVDSDPDVIKIGLEEPAVDSDPAVIDLGIDPAFDPEPVINVKPEPVFDTAFDPEPIVKKEPDPVVEVKPVVNESEPVVELEPGDEDVILDFLSKPVKAPQEERRHTTQQSVRPQPSLFPEEPAEPTKPEPRRSLNDVLMEQKEDNTIASSFQNSKVKDLAKSISINDKFQFIKELFRGKGEEFGMAIQKLNRCDSLEEAFNEIDIMKKFYFWDTSSPSYLALCDLVRRKFI